MVYCSNVDACWSSRSLEGKDRGVHPLPKTSRGKSSVQATCLTDWRGRATQNGFSTTNRLLSRVPVTGSRILDTIVLSTLLGYWPTTQVKVSPSQYCVRLSLVDRRAPTPHQILAGFRPGHCSLPALLSSCISPIPQLPPAGCRHIAYPRAQGHWKSLKRLGASAPLQHL